MVGAHLDSVGDGPGINDNGSGSAAILEVAEQMRKVKPDNTVRFAWWGAEESGLVGSDFYVNSLDEAEQDDIALYLNFDMVGSPNYVRFVYDGDGSPSGSGRARRVRRPSRTVQRLLRRSRPGLRADRDRLPVRLRRLLRAGNDIPFGGLFTGAEGIKTPEQVAVYGGTAGQQYDPCYHAGLRHVRQQQRRRARPQQRRRRPRDAHLRDEHRDGHRPVGALQAQPPVGRGARHEPHPSFTRRPGAGCRATRRSRRGKTVAVVDDALVGHRRLQVDGFAGVGSWWVTCTTVLSTPWPTTICSSPSRSGRSPCRTASCGQRTARC